MHRETITVELSARSYPIHIGADILQHQLNLKLPGTKVLIVTDETVAPLYLDDGLKFFADYQTSSIVLPDGEQYKTLDTVNRIYTKLLKSKFDRNCTLAALGGGVIGDITGFAAATYQRGVNFIQIPTTLLAQVDSSVGGKTGVNHRSGKNMIGAFYQPQAVFIDTATLNTLDERQFSSGLAEVIKYGLINDPDFYNWIDANIDRLQNRNPKVLNHAIKLSCLNKANIVAKDELEAGERALLNLGHTFGHAIEAGAGYGKWLHGEAVAAGTVMAAFISHLNGWLSKNEFNDIKELLRRAHLPVKGPGMAVAEYLSYMAVDKKVQDGKIKLVLLAEIGKAVLRADYERIKLEQAITEYG